MTRAAISCWEEAQEWNSLILSTPGYSFFHSAAWARVISETYGYSPCLMVCREGDRFAALPIAVVPRLLAGRKGVCLPFSDSCVPVSTDPHILKELWAGLLRLARDERWSALEVHGDCRGADFSPYESYYEHIITLDARLEKAFASLRSSTRRNIQRSASEGVAIELRCCASAVDEYYRLHCITRKRLGVPPQPKSFFDSVYRQVIEPGNGFVLRARWREKTVSAAMFLHFGKKAVYKFGASLPDNEHLRPNNLVMWEAIKWYASRGFESLSLGRSDKDGHGLLQFKNGWGAECRELTYWRWPALRGKGTRPRKAPRHLAGSVLRLMPIPLLRMAGNMLYRYFP